MATMKQLKDMQNKLQVQVDTILAQINNIEKQEMGLRKQMLTANPAQKASLTAKLAQLTQQKAKLSGDVTVQSEDVMASAMPIDSSSAGGTPNAPLGANDEMSTSSIGGKFPKKITAQVGKRKEKTDKVFGYVDKLGTKGTGK